MRLAPDELAPTVQPTAERLVGRQAAVATGQAVVARGLAQRRAHAAQAIHAHRGEAALAAGVWRAGMDAVVAFDAFLEDHGSFSRRDRDLPGAQ
jgi:hypothetical protein